VANQQTGAPATPARAKTGMTDRARRRHWNHWLGVRRAPTVGKQPTNNDANDFKGKPRDGSQTDRRSSLDFSGFGRDHGSADDTTAAKGRSRVAGTASDRAGAGDAHANRRDPSFGPQTARWALSAQRASEARIPSLRFA
jgi:hypothetical protein